MWPRRLCVLGMLVVFAAAIDSWAQEPSTPPPSQTAAAPSATTISKAGAGKYSHANDFLIRGTVFNEKALSFPNVELRIRRAGEKKFHWQSFTDSRGEFAIRVPKGAEYEMVVHRKSFKDQVRTIDTKSGMSEQSIIFRMEPGAGEKK